MITSGWILPDLHEVKCKSTSTLNGHIEVVKRYLDALKTRDIKTYDRIVATFHRESSNLPTLGLDDFAVMHLGWIKINNKPTNMIFYTDNCKAELTIKRYINLNYYPVVFNSHRIQISVYIPSRELI